MTLLDDARAFVTGRSDDGAEMVHRLLVENARLEAAIMQSDALRRAWQDSARKADAEFAWLHKALIALIGSPDIEHMRLVAESALAEQKDAG